MAPAGFRRGGAPLSLRRPGRRLHVKRRALGGAGHKEFTTILPSRVGRHALRYPALREWLQQRPRWLRRPIEGALLLWGYMVATGGIVVVGLLAVLTFFSSARLLGQLAYLVFILIPGAGFLGGLFYAAVEAVTSGWGDASVLLSWIAGTFRYMLGLVFSVMPLIAPGFSGDIANPLDWGITVLMGFLFGFVLAIVALADKETGAA